MVERKVGCCDVTSVITNRVGFGRMPHNSGSAPDCDPRIWRSYDVCRDGKKRSLIAATTFVLFEGTEVNLKLDHQCFCIVTNCLLVGLSPNAQGYAPSGSKIEGVRSQRRGNCYGILQLVHCIDSLLADIS